MLDKIKNIIDYIDDSPSLFVTYVTFIITALFILMVVVCSISLTN